MAAALPAAAESDDSAEEAGAPAEESQAEREPPKILHFIELRLEESWVHLYVDKVSGTLPPPDVQSARLVDFRMRHSTASLQYRVQAGPLLGFWFRAGILHLTMRDSMRKNADFLPIPPDSRVTETVPADLGAEFGLGLDLRFPVYEKLITGVHYELTYGVARFDHVMFLQRVIDGEYRYFGHSILVFLERRWVLEEPFKGSWRPRLGLGGYIYRANADMETPDGSLEGDWKWIADQGLLLRLDLLFESDGGLFAFFRADLVARYSMQAGLGIKF